jgi:ribosome-associated translation inhibitor RaiA
MAKIQPTLPPNLHIAGDTLALDRTLRRLIVVETRQLQERFPDQTVDLRVRICEEFDQTRGHQVRCEVVAALPNRRQVVVREFRKEPRHAITEVFAATKVQLRRLRRRSILPMAPATTTLSAAGI